MDGESLLSGLTPTQRAAVVTTEEPLCILAGAGAGKTRVLTRRIAYRVASGTADPRHVLALTFTRRAAGEMAGRLRQLGMRSQVAAGTFHAIAYAQLRQYWADRGETAPVLLKRKSRLVAELVRDRPHLGDVPVSGLAAEIEWAKARLVSPERYEQATGQAGRPPPAAPDAVAALYARYEVEKQRRRLADFDDLLARCATALESDSAFAAAQRWRWRHLFVDEFQDVNPLQHRLLLAWLGARLDLCVVGDLNQAIYAWNGADPELLRDLQMRWPDTRVVVLEDNHRCTPQVVATAAAVLGDDGAGLRSTRPPGLATVIRRYGSERAEVRGIAVELGEARARGLGWAQLAVLFRTNAQASLLEEALQAANVPYRVSGVSASRETDTVSEQTAAEEFERSERPGDAVTLSTFHRAKGLEWAAVWVAGLERGLVPIGHATTTQALAEERRLLYVALTRAALELHCSWAEWRSFTGHPIPRDPSPWLEPMARASVGPSELGQGVGQSDEQVGWKELLAAQRNRLASCRRPGGDIGTPASRPNPVVLEALRTWRATTARAAGVPPFVLFHDVTLGALAASRPSTDQELLAVPGLGPVKVARYGVALLALMAEHRATA